MKHTITITETDEQVTVECSLSFTAHATFYGANYPDKMDGALDAANTYARGLEAGIRAIAHSINSIHPKTVRA